MLYKIVRGQDVFELNPGLKLIEEYAELDSRQMVYVILICDPSIDNPIRTLPDKQRKERALEIAGYPRENDRDILSKNARETMNGKRVTVERAIVRFKKDHYDANRDTFEALDAQITAIREFLKQPDKDSKELERAVKLGEKLPNLIEAKQKLEALLSLQSPRVEGFTGTVSDLESVPEEARNLSMLDQLTMNGTIEQMRNTK